MSMATEEKKYGLYGLVQSSSKESTDQTTPVSILKPGNFANKLLNWIFEIIYLYPKPFKFNSTRAKKVPGIDISLAIQF